MSIKNQSKKKPAHDKHVIANSCVPSLNGKPPFLKKRIKSKPYIVFSFVCYLGVFVCIIHHFFCEKFRPKTKTPQKSITCCTVLPQINFFCILLASVFSASSRAAAGAGGVWLATVPVHLLLAVNRGVTMSDVCYVLALRGWDRFRGTLWTFFPPLQCKFWCR